MQLDNVELGKFLMDEIFVSDCYKLKDLIGKSVKTIVDIGANNGVFALYARVLFPRARIVCVEPCPATYARLVSNMENLSVETLQVGLGDGTPIKLVPNSHIGDSGSFVGVPGEEAQTYKFPDLLKLINVQLGADTIIKIDCEGGERFMVKDQESLDLLALSNRWMMEVHYHQRQWPNCPDRGFYGEFQRVFGEKYNFNIRYRSNKQYGLIVADKK